MPTVRLEIARAAGTSVRRDVFLLPPLGSKGCFRQADQALNSFQEISPPSSSQDYSTSSQARSEDTWHRLTYITSLRVLRWASCSAKTRHPSCGFPSVGCLTDLAFCEARRDRVHDHCSARTLPHVQTTSDSVLRHLCPTAVFKDPGSLVRAGSDVACASSSDAESSLFRTGTPESFLKSTAHLPPAASST